MGAKRKCIRQSEWKNPNCLIYSLHFIWILILAFCTIWFLTFYLFSFCTFWCFMFWSFDVNLIWPIIFDHMYFDVSLFDVLYLTFDLLAPVHLRLSSYFSSMVANLPQKYELGPDKYDMLINVFGTHFWLKN